jgi:hypothetical protein
MDIVIQNSQSSVNGIQVENHQILLPMRALMDKAQVVASIYRLYELIKRCVMRFKPCKSQSQSQYLCQGKPVPNTYIIGTELILTLTEQPAKSLGRWYSLLITDRFPCHIIILHTVLVVARQTINPKHKINKNLS